MFNKPFTVIILLRICQHQLNPTKRTDIPVDSSAVEAYWKEPFEAGLKRHDRQGKGVGYDYLDI